MFVFKIHKIIYSFFFCILFFVNIMKQNLYAFLQTCMDLNLSLVFLQNLSLLKKKNFGLLYPFFFFVLILSKLDFFFN